MADGFRALAAQALGKDVQAVAGLFDGILDPLARLLGDEAALMQNPGYGSRRDLGFAGDVF